ncbi:MAG TPA: urease accessory protein UreE [Devosia sp.]
MGETLRAVAYVPSGTATGFDIAVLFHDERRVRRRVIPLEHGDEVLVDFPNPVTLEDRGLLQLEDGRFVEIIAGEEQLYEVRGRDAKHLMQLAWHIGNRHAKAQIVAEWQGIGDRILILRDHVLRDMLRGLGATVNEVSEPFSPMEGAYSHDHGHALLNR